MVEVIAAFILGCSVGMCVYRFSIINVIGKNPTTKCDYCKFRILTGKEPFPQKKEEIAP